MKQLWGRIRSLEEVKNTKMTSKGVQYRCNMKSFIKTMRDVKDDLQGRPLELLRATPFWPIIDAYHSGMVEEQHVTKSDDDLTMLIKAYDGETQRFAFGSKFSAISVGDVSQILGLPENGTKLPMKKEGRENTTFVQTYFGRVKRIKKAMVDKALIRAIRYGKESPQSPNTSKCEGEGEEVVLKRDTDEDVVRLILLELFITFLFPNSGAFISWNCVKHCEDLDKIPTYAWAPAVRDYLHKALKRKKEKPTSLGGCQIVILFWLCEKTHMIPIIRGREGAKLGIVKWSLPMLHNMMNPLGTIGFESYIEDCNTQEDCQLKLGTKDQKGDPGEDDPSESEKEANGKELEKEEHDGLELGPSLKDWMTELQTQTEEIGTPPLEQKKAGKLYKELSAQLQVGIVKVEMLTKDIEKERRLRTAVEMKLQEAKLEARRVEEEKNILLAEKEALFEKVKELEKTIAKNKDTRQIVDDEETSVIAWERNDEELKEGKKRKAEDKEELLVGETLCFSKQLKKLEKVILQDKEMTSYKEYEDIRNEVNKQQIQPHENQSTLVAHGIQSSIVHDTKMDSPSLMADGMHSPDVHRVKSPRVLSVRIDSPPPLTPQFVSPLPIAQDSILYSYVVRLKKRKRAENEDDTYALEVKDENSSKATQNEDANKQKSLNPSFILLDACASSPIQLDDEQVQQVEVINWYSHVVYKLLDECTQIKLRDYWDQAPREFFWQGDLGNNVITREDIMKLVTDGAIANNVIDAFGELLDYELMQGDSNPARKTEFLHSWSWIYTKEKNVKGKHQFLFEPLFQKLGKCDKLLIPIVSSSAYHHTLLVLDKNSGKWIHFNPQRTRRITQDVCFHNAQEMVDMIHQWMTAVKDQAEELLQQGCRMKVNSRQDSKNELKFTEVKLSDDEIKTIKWVSSVNDMPLQSNTTCPQQHPTSLDCGIFVIYYMDQISKEEELVPIDISTEKVQEFRAQMIQRFIRHKLSWSEKQQAKSIVDFEMVGCG